MNAFHTTLSSLKYRSERSVFRRTQFVFFPCATDLFSDSFAAVVHGGEECITLQVSAARQRRSTLSESKNSSHSRLPGQGITQPIITLSHFSCESYKSLHLHTLGRRMDMRFFNQMLRRWSQISFYVGRFATKISRSICETRAAAIHKL